LVQEKGISLFRESSAQDRQKVYDLIHDYKAFLKRYHREKPYQALDHDMTLLDAVGRLRSKAKSSLDAEALCVTTDFLLFKFDWGRASSSTLPATILPSQLLQLVRPFVPITDDFDRSFAESFAIPEFRAMGDGSQSAAARLLEIVASYSDIGESTVTALLANDLLLDGIDKSKNERQIREYVESAIASQNIALTQEQERLEAELEKANREREEVVGRVKSEFQLELEERLNDIRLQAESERAALEAARLAATLEKDKVVQELRYQASSEREEADRLRTEAELRATSAEAELEHLRTHERERTESRKRISRTTIGIIAAIAFAILCEWLIRRYSFPWLMDHPQSYGLRGAFYTGSAALLIGALRRDWLRTCLKLAVIPAIFIILQLVGGPRH